MTSRNGLTSLQIAVGKGRMGTPPGTNHNGAMSLSVATHGNPLKTTDVRGWKITKRGGGLSEIDLLSPVAVQGNWGEESVNRKTHLRVNGKTAERIAEEGGRTHGDRRIGDELDRMDMDIGAHRVGRGACGRCGTVGAVVDGEIVVAGTRG